MKYYLPTSKSHFSFCRYFDSWIESAEDVEDSWWQDDEKGKNNESDSSSSDSQESICCPSKLTPSEIHSVSFFNSKSESSEGVVFRGNVEALVPQSGDLSDTEVRWS